MAAFEAKQLGSTVGAELSGVDLGTDLSDEVIAEIRQALHDYKVIFFRDQPLTPAQHVASPPFRRPRGPPVPAVQHGRARAGPFREDGRSHRLRERLASRCDVAGVPVDGGGASRTVGTGIGGDTLFSDMYAAYDGLDDSTRQEIDGLVAVHDFTQTFGHGMTEEDRRKAQEQYPPVRHPVVCTHPATGKLHLYVNRPFTSHIEGMEPDDSLELLDRLCRMADSPEHQCRFVWSRDAVAFWDNRAVQHYASSDYWPHFRTMERASIIGTRPART